MAKADILSQIYAPKTNEYDFNFNTLVAPPLLSMLTVEDIKYLNYIAVSPRFSGKIDVKYSEIKKVMNNRGFRKLHAGTNRVVYVNPDIPGIVLKVCTNSIALTDAPNEYKNQMYLAPFVSKVFEYSPCGTVGVFERADPITSRQEFLSISDSVFELLNKKILGEFILEDIGSQYFMNWAIRRIGGDKGRAWGPIMIDFPTMFKLDGKKLFCNNINQITGKRCTGVIDYDAGFNHLICPVCGKQYQARQLAKYEEDNSIIIANKKGDKKMKVLVKRGNEVVSTHNENSSNVIKSNVANKLNVSVKKEEVVAPVVEEKKVVNNKTVQPTITKENPLSGEEADIAMLRVLFAKYPKEGAKLIQEKFYLISKSQFDENPTDRILINDQYEYIRSDIVDSTIRDLTSTTEEPNDEIPDPKEIVEQIKAEEESNEDELDNEMTKPTDQDFDENGKFKVETGENLPFIDSKKAKKF